MFRRRREAFCVCAGSRIASFLAGTESGGIHVRDSELKRTGKPAHIVGSELWRHGGGDTGPLSGEMHRIEPATRSPRLVEYTSGDRGKTLRYASRRVNTRGQKGPRSEIISATVL
jgi:hypothetical protein